MFASRSIFGVFLAGAVLWCSHALAQTRSSTQPAELTIDALVKLRQAELQEEFNQRVKKLAPPPPITAPAPAAAASMPVFLRPVVLPPKRVAAIYGRVGAELADIEMPSGEMKTVAVGAQIETYRVTSIDAKGVEILGFAPSKDIQRSASVVPVSASKGRRGGRESKPVDKSHPDTETQEVRRRIPLGGTFD